MIYLMVRASGRPRDPRQDRRRAQPERGQHGRKFSWDLHKKKETDWGAVSSLTESEQVWDLGLGAGVGGR